MIFGGWIKNWVAREIFHWDLNDAQHVEIWYSKTCIAICDKPKEVKAALRELVDVFRQFVEFSLRVCSIYLGEMIIVYLKFISCGQLKWKEKNRWWYLSLPEVKKRHQKSANEEECVDAEGTIRDSLEEKRLFNDLS